MQGRANQERSSSELGLEAIARGSHPWAAVSRPGVEVETMLRIVASRPLLVLRREPDARSECALGGLRHPPGVPSIMFARSARPGWDAWGNEAPGGKQWATIRGKAG